MRSVNKVDIKIQNGTNIPGTHPIIIIGPNGSGKTTFGAKLASHNNATWISATRNLDFSDAIPMAKTEAAESNLSANRNQQRNSIWRQAHDFIHLMTKLKAENVESALAFKQAYLDGERAAPPPTKLDKLADIWASMFPERKIDFFVDEPKVTALHGDNISPFSYIKMSGGERVALYLLATIIDAPAGIIIIDEPEIHFHGLLSRKFWNEVEIFRSDCRFIYITHDLPFAISRKNGQFMIINPKMKEKIFPPEKNIPDEIIESVLGAATFSISAKNFIFCESKKNNKKDPGFYSAWLKDDDTVVIPVGSCDQVIDCVAVFNSNEALKGLQAKGIIDRDFRPDDYLENPPENIYVLALHEIESLYCTKEVFTAMAKHLGIKDADIKTKYQNFITKGRNRFKNNSVEKNKIILNRVKQRTEEQTKKILNELDTESDINAIKKNYIDALKVENWPFDPSTCFEEEMGKIEAALEEKASEKELLKIFPGKDLFSIALGELGVNQERFLILLNEVLNISESDDKNSFQDLKMELIAGLKSYKPF